MSVPIKISSIHPSREWSEWSFLPLWNSKTVISSAGIKSAEPTGLKLRVGGCNGTKRFPFWLAPRPRVLWKLIIASAYNDPLRWFEASSSGCSAGANWQSLSRPAMNYEPIIHGCRAEFTRVYRLQAEAFSFIHVRSVQVRKLVRYEDMWESFLRDE